ncbi:chemotaxis protein CheX [Cognatilysobacter lacus]|uniref:Chemotaxis protein CheX n=1 Tax=Cognatilysobacter lacus TaxID=1643323 RepID=A0A5D8ZFV3_9GAMM|nr:chemotaxis protein CheX [Lysobacter lacus]TZF91554.1 chemotaxis protein CheX [Lysobacter lacus]
MAAAKFFGQFLLEKGVIDAPQLLRALEIQRMSNPALGEIACGRGMLTAHQAQAINERQRREDKRFGDIAQSMGLLTADEVGQLLDEQKSRRKLFGEILVEQGYVERHRLDDELRLHSADRDEAARSLDAIVATHQFGRRVGNAIATCNKLFPRLLRTQCQFSSVIDPLAPPHVDAAALVRVAADRPLVIGMACDGATMHAMAQAFLSIPPEACDEELARDALGELVNMLMGYVVKDSLAEDANYTASPPDFETPLSGLDSELHVLVTMTSQLGPFILVVGD